MGAYHSTTVLYGARLITPKPQETQWKVLEQPAAIAILDRFEVKADTAGTNVWEDLYLYTDYHDLEIGGVFSTASVHGDQLSHWRQRIEACADALGMEIEDVGWITVHEYR